MCKTGDFLHISCSLICHKTQVFLSLFNSKFAQSLARNDWAAQIQLKTVTAIQSILFTGVYSYIIFNLQIFLPCDDSSLLYRKWRQGKHKTNNCLLSLKYPSHVRFVAFRLLNGAVLTLQRNLCCTKLICTSFVRGCCFA